MESDALLVDYYRQWTDTYKEGAVRDVTLRKYRLAENWLRKNAATLRLKDLNRVKYQSLLNAYAQDHEHQTTMDFHHLLKAAVLDAVDERLIDRDPTRKAVIKGCVPREKKTKYLNQFELHTLLGDLNLEGKPCDNWDWLVLLIAKTGLRFAEALGLTPADIDLARQCIDVNKTWSYKDGSGFAPTKNKSSKRKVTIDWTVATQMAAAINGIQANRPIFVPYDGDEPRDVYNSTANAILARHCKRVGVPVISIHGLRHTHASIMLYAGASVASVSRRLGHSSISTTQKVYLHVIQEMENQDTDLMMRALSAL